MKIAVVCLVLFTAFMVQPAAAHTTIRQMLRDAAINHDLDKVKIDLLKIQRRVDAEDRVRANGVADPAQEEAKPVTHP